MARRPDALPDDKKETRADPTNRIALARFLERRFAYLPFFFFFLPASTAPASIADDVSVAAAGAVSAGAALGMAEADVSVGAALADEAAESVDAGMSEAPASETESGETGGLGLSPPQAAMMAAAANGATRTSLNFCMRAS